MLSFPISKLLQASLLAASLIGSAIGMHHFKKILPTTGYASSIVFKDNSAVESLQDFVRLVENGQKNTVVGIYVPGKFALPVGQQPKGNAGFVTRESNKATQFDLANQYGTVGILAHNDLAGSEFADVGSDEYAIVVYGDGHLEYYVIRNIEKYQALSPTSTYSDFVNLDGSGKQLSASQLFNNVYGAGDRLVLQNCIDAHGNPYWGRMFIIAEPATRQVLSVMQRTTFLLEFASFGLAYH